MEASTNEESSRIGPNKYTYDSIIFCYKNSNLPDKADKALAILEKMKGGGRGEGGGGAGKGGGKGNGGSLGR